MMSIAVLFGSELAVQAVDMGIYKYFRRFLEHKPFLNFTSLLDKISRI